MSKAFQNLGIRQKLQRMTFVICGAVLVVAVAALFTFEVLNFRLNFRRDSEALATVIANNCTAAMAFKDEQVGNEVVNALRGDPAIVAATVVLPDGQVLAHFGQAESPASRNQFPAAGQSKFLNGQLLITAPIVAEHDQLGTLYLRSDYQKTFLALLRFYAEVICAVALASAALSLFLSNRLGRTITDPVLQLAKTAQVVGEKKDYSVRAVVTPRGDELGILTKSFNEMLERIQSQDVALNLSQQKLEALINSIDGIVWERPAEDSKFTFISRQSESLLGYPPPLWLEEPGFWESKLHPQDSAKAIQTGQELAASGQPYHYEYRILAADGRVVWMRESGMALIENGRPSAWRGIMQDITRQKQDAEQLDKLNRQLIDTSRQAGMADVATGVLHNVGNVLNSVSVAATVVGDRLRNSKLLNLRRAAAMMREQNGNLAAFLTTDARGKLLPEYFMVATEELEDERGKIVSKMDALARHIEHIKQIVSMQQSYAKVSGVYENLSAVDLVEDALRINFAAFDRHGIDVVREFDSNLPPVCVDRHKVLQILINLLRNAKHAMEDHAKDEKRLVIRLRATSGQKIEILIRDNGIGIPTENLTRIFNHGFTTKKSGHGFGLHSGANAAREMGGSLRADSAGAGQGAEFTLELPTTPAGRLAAAVPTTGEET